MHSFFLKDFIGRHVTEREQSLFLGDINNNREALSNAIENKTVLVIGGAGSIGSSFIKALLPFRPASLTVVDNNENGLAELVRDLRSGADNIIPPSFTTYPMDLASRVFKKILTSRHFDIIANFAAHKHVRSEKDQFSVEAMITNNVLSAHYLLENLRHDPPSHFFCVSTDKAANPVNIMGASKKLMEEVIFSRLNQVPITTARFANVAFSNGSLPASFLERIAKRQPISAPEDVKRFFVSPEESGEICLLACVLGKPGEILFPKLSTAGMKTFSEIATRLLTELGFTPLYCKTEQEARDAARALFTGSKQYPVYYFTSDTTGEKAFEEFYTEGEEVDWNRFSQLGVIRRSEHNSVSNLSSHIHAIEKLFLQDHYSKSQVVEILQEAISSFNHMETGKYLDEKM